MKMRSLVRMVIMTGILLALTLTAYAGEGIIQMGGR